MHLSRNYGSVALAVLSIGCHSWKTVGVEPNPDPASRPSKIEITTASRGSFTVYYPEVREDSLHGWFDDARENPAGFSVKEINSAKVRQLNGEKTASLIVGIGVLGLLTWVSGMLLVLSTL